MRIGFGQRQIFVENGQIVGIITESDLFRLIVRRHIGVADAEAPAEPTISDIPPR